MKLKNYERAYMVAYLSVSLLYMLETTGSVFWNTFFYAKEALFNLALLYSLYKRISLKWDLSFIVAVSFFQIERFIYNVALMPTERQVYAKYCTDKNFTILFAISIIIILNFQIFKRKRNDRNKKLLG